MAIHYSTLGEMLDQYIGGRKRDKWFTKIWLWFKPKEYIERRDKIFDRQAKIRAKIIMRKELAKGEYLLKNIASDNCRANYISVPLVYKEDKSDV